MSRKDQSSLTIIVDGRPLGVFDKRSGGGVDSEETKYREGAMGPQLSLGGPVTVENVTATRLFKLQRDSELLHWLLARVGQARATVSEQPLDAEGFPFGRPFVWTGGLKTVTKGEHDSMSSDPDTFDIVISTEGNVA